MSEHDVMKTHLESIFFLLFPDIICQLFYLLSPVNELLKAAGTGNFTPKKGSKSYGTIAVDECKITGAESSTSATVRPGTSAAADPSVVPMPVPVPVQQFGGMSMGGGTPVPVPPPQRPTFVDYISGSCDLNLVRMIYYS